MANYYVINRTDRAGDALYGVCACSLCNGVMEVHNCVYGVSDDMVWLKALRDKLNDGEVDPVHLDDIIADELYVMKH